MEAAPKLKPRTIVAADPFVLMRLILGAPIVLVCGFFLFKIISLTHDPFELLEFHGSFVGTLIVFSLVIFSHYLGFLIFGIIGAKRRVPAVTLDEKGITLKTHFRLQRWTWNETGPFSLSYRLWPYYRFWPFVGRRLSPAACAYLRPTHEMLASQGHLREPTVHDADIRLPFKFIWGPRGTTNAEAFVSELNAWRERHAGETGTTIPSSEDAVSRLEFSLFLKRQKRWLLPIYIIVVFGVLIWSMQI